MRTDDLLYNLRRSGDYRFVEWSVLDRFERTGLAATYRRGDTEVALRP